MYNTQFIADVLEAEIEREADYLGKTVHLDPETVAEAVSRIEREFAKFAKSSEWRYSEDREQTQSDRLCTLIDQTVTKFFA
jgi:hypothetical protein